MDSKEQKRGRGGNRKSIAPEGLYTAKQAQERLGYNANRFFYLVRSGVITSHIPPDMKNGYYSQKEIDTLANALELFEHTHKEMAASTITRPATTEDAQGIYDVLDSFGWPTASVEQRLAFWSVNPFIDYVVVQDDRIRGYITAVPYTPSAMEDIMSGKRRAWDMTPADILPYQLGHTYDLYVGIATIQDSKYHTWYSFRLIAGFINFIGHDLVKQSITIRRMYAVSDQEAGKRLCEKLSFIRQEKRPGDRFPRFELDLETSDSRFAKIYRESIAK